MEVSRLKIFLGALGFKKQFSLLQSLGNKECMEAYPR